MSGIRGNIEFEFNLAVKQGNARRLRTLIKHRIPPPNRIMLFALIRKHPELLSQLHEAGANPNDADGFNETALGHAVNYYSPDVAESLIGFGADPNKESLHLLPLLNAATLGKVEHIKVLLKGGADPNHVQWNGLVPLLAAVRSGESEVARLLLEAGADPAKAGPDGKNSIELAHSLKCNDLCKLLKSFVRRDSTRATKGRGRTVSSRKPRSRSAK